MPKEIPLVIFHANCPDGFGAAWAIHKVMPDAEFMPMRYEDEPPDVTGRDVIIADFSFKKPVLKKLIDQASNFLLLDHHKSAQAELEGMPNCHFDMNHSGARLAWDYFMGGQPHWLIDYVEDKDLWKFELPNSREINDAIASYPREFDAWDALSTQELGTLIFEGTAIGRYKAEQITMAVNGAGEREIAGFRVKVANVSVVNLTSEVAGKLAEGRPFGAAWYEADGRRNWSLRSREGGEDVSLIAKKFGGGGHEHAAGYAEDAHA